MSNFKRSITSIFLTVVLSFFWSVGFAHNSNFDPTMIHKCGVYGSGQPFDVVPMNQECVAPKVAAHTAYTPPGCLSIPVSTNLFPVTSYGAIANDNISDSAAINLAINAASAAHGTVTLPAGTFNVEVNVVKLKSNITFKMQPNTILKVKGTTLQSYEVLGVRDVVNVQITGGTIKGERLSHTGTAGEWGHGIQVSNSSVVNIDTVKSNDNFGDGLYIGSNSSHVRVCNSLFQNNRRNNGSITSGSDIVLLNNAWVGANGTSPKTGLDLEPNDGEVLDLVTVDGNFMLNNLGYGASSGFESATGSSTRISFENNTIDNNTYGLVLARQNGVNVSFNKILNSKEEGVYMYVGTTGTQLHDNIIKNTGLGSLTNGDGIGIYLDTVAGNPTTGNFITDNQIIDSFWSSITDFGGGNTYSGNVVNSIYAPDHTYIKP